MEHLLDIISIATLGIVACGFLYKSYKKIASGCGNMCSGCNTGCPSKVKQFNPKVIPLKKIA